MNGLVGAYLGFNLLLGVSWLALRVSSRGLLGGSPASRGGDEAPSAPARSPSGALLPEARSLVGSARVMLVASAALPLAASALSVGGWAPPAAQTFAGLAPQAAAQRAVDAGVGALTTVAPGLVTAGAAAPWSTLLAVALSLAAFTTLARMVLAWRSVDRALDGAPLVTAIGRVRVVAAPGIEVPFSVWRPGRAWVALPAAMVGGGADPEAWRLALAHELQHHRQGDTRWLYALTLASGLAFWNPLARRFAREVVDLSELSCDQALLARGIARVRYARCLLEVAERALNLPTPGPLPALLTTGMAGRRGAFTTRMNHMLSFDPSAPRRRPGPLTLALTLPLMVAGALLTAQAAPGAGADLDRARAAVTATAGGGFPLVLNPQVEAMLNKLATQDKAQAWIHGGLARLPAMEAELSRPLAARGLPTELVAVAMAESALQNLPPEENLRSGGPGSAGVWQFIPQTARTYGLTVEGDVDQRMDVGLESDAAAHLLSDLYTRYGDWGLALAAYNAGHVKVDEALAEGASRDVYALMDKGLLPTYPAIVMACAIAIQDPQVVGYAAP